MANTSHALRAEGRPLLAIVTETFAPEINGVAHTLNQLCLQLTQTCDLQVIHPTQAPDVIGSNEEATKNPALTRFNIKGLPIPAYRELRFGLPCQRKLSQLWNVNKPDGIYIATQGPLGWSAIRAATALKLSSVSGFHTNFHNYSQHYGFGWLRSVIQKYLVHFHNRTKFTLVPTQQVAKEVSDMGINNARVCSRGVDQQIFNSRRRSACLRHAWGVKGDDPVYLCVGRLAKEKNIELALHAFTRARQQVPGLQMVLVGGGPLAKTIAAQHPQIHLAGIKQGVELATYYASADIFLFPSVTETFGNVLLEAAASGLAIVSYDIAAAKQHFIHRKHACLANPGDEDQFCKLALELASRPTELKRLRTNIGEICPSLQWQTIAKQFRDYLLVAANGGKHEAVTGLKSVQSRG